MSFTQRRVGRPRKSREQLELEGPLIRNAQHEARKATAPSVDPQYSVIPNIKAREFRRDYVRVAWDYARRAISDEQGIEFGKWMRFAAERFFNDLCRACDPDPPFYFDEYSACDVCDFVEGLPHVEGTWDSVTINLHDSDIFFLVNLFGFRSWDGSRRFTSALKAVARKNAKSTLAAAIGLYCQNCEEELGPQVLSAATTGSQARIIFSIAQRMVERTPTLRDKYNLNPLANAIAAYTCGGTFKPINSKASTQDGLNPSCVLLDEIHAHRTHDLVNVLRSAAGARRNPLFLFTTTEGYESPGPWPELRHLAKQILEGVIEADHFFVVYYAVDDDDDDFAEYAWRKANPLMESNPLLLKKIREEAMEAKQMPGRLAEFRIKRLNRPASTAGGWVNLVQWQQCGQKKFDPLTLTQYPCWGGLDLALTRDIASLRLVWLVDGIWFTHGWRWVPKAAVKQRSERGLVPYQAWVMGKYIEQAGDEVIDYEVVEHRIHQVKNTFNLQKIGYDGWNAQQLSAKLKEAKIPMEMFIQGPKSYHPAMQELERAYVAGKLVHQNDPVLNWCASNLVARTDVNLNMAPDKKNAPDKIDDMVALLMAMGTAISSSAATPAQKFQLFFV